MPSNWRPSTPRALQHVFRRQIRQTAQKTTRETTAWSMPRDRASSELIKTKHTITIKIYSFVKDSAYKRTYPSDSLSSLRFLPSSHEPAMQGKLNSTARTSSFLNFTTNRDSPHAPFLKLGKLKPIRQTTPRLKLGLKELPMTMIRPTTPGNLRKTHFSLKDLTKIKFTELAP